VSGLSPIHPGLPYRGRFGDPRAATLAGLTLPPRPMPSHAGLRPLKAWRYVGVYGRELMLCVASVRIGRARQSFWAVWDRDTRRLTEQTFIGRGGVRLSPGQARVRDVAAEIDLALEETAGVECVCPSGGGYAWTRKQGGIRASGVVILGDLRRELDARAVIDDTAAYYERHTRWRWSAGVGQAQDGREVAWNLVSGVNDPPQNSERTVWIADRPHEVGPCSFAEDLRGVDGLRFASEAVRRRHDNLLLLRSSYRQPFGTFSGELPGGLWLAEGFGVMEEHDAWW
jgi:Domain of unknown function (DUF2804), C-terminal